MRPQQPSRGLASSDWHRQGFPGVWASLAVQCVTACATSPCGIGCVPCFCLTALHHGAGPLWADALWGSWAHGVLALCRISALPRVTVLGSCVVLAMWTLLWVRALHLHLCRIFLTHTATPHVWTL